MYVVYFSIYSYLIIFLVHLLANTITQGAPCLEYLYIKIFQPIEDVADTGCTMPRSIVALLR